MNEHFQIENQDRFLYSLLRKDFYNQYDPLLIFSLLNKVENKLWDIIWGPVGMKVKHFYEIT